MNKINVIGLVALLATATVSANNVIVFPGTSDASVTEASITFPQEKTPVPLVGGYQIEQGVLTSRTYNCGINISDLEIEAKLHWNGATPQLVIVGAYPATMCRAGFTGPFSVDLTEFIHNTPTYILDQLEVANVVNLGL
ncbi:hypothetical protein FM037_11565 [Shewanella psychropiezotolerans]|uniref:Orphan protein n=1 Tax=Shewanella psychropiezotolerans TaxID=2593655 RepID=A0ABX5WXF5_9GAMM|nr:MULTISPECIES: hypothetical protein [Shewanella]MPY26583.1 hypothetical protein [Shewanella sp. YLB-07]QDO83754.1 hypothetical protein FM037_11565 [Shewanella psychropiezotolerans]